MLLALFTVRSVSLSEIAVAMQDKTNKESREKRVYRFFRYFEVDFTSIAKWLYYLMFSEDEKVYIAIDRTNWYWGKAKINIFMLSVCYEGIAIPIFWTLLKKAGQLFGNLSPMEHSAFGMRITIFWQDLFLAVAFVWAHRIGEFQSTQKRIPLKTLRK